MIMLGTREPGGGTNSLPAEGQRDRLRVGAPVYVDAAAVAPDRRHECGTLALLAEHLLTTSTGARVDRPDLPGPAARAPSATPTRTGVTEEKPMTSSSRRPRPRSRVGPVPVLAVVGRPNVGKSTLVNRIIGRREAVVEDVPGVTRDRVSYDANWNGRAFTVVDTGGWDPDARGMAERIRAQAEIAVDARRRGAVRGRRDGRHHRRRRGRREDPARSPASRSCSPPTRSTTSAPRPRPTACGTSAWASRTRSPRCTAAGRGDLLDAVLAALPEPPPRADARGRRPAPDRHRRQAQRRQVLAAQQAGRRGPGRRRRRRRHHRRPGRRAGRARRPDLAVHRHRRHPQAGQGGVRPRVLRLAAHHRPRSSAPRSPCSCVDASEPISEQDLRIIQTVREAGRALVIAFNKWDLVDEERRYYLDREIERDLVQVQWAPRINITARTGWHVDRLVPALDKALDGLGDPDRRPARSTRSSAGWSPSTRTRCAAASSPRSCSAPRPSTAPPTFVLFTSGKLEAGYERFIERRLREEFGFVGTPIHIQQRPREKRKR